MGKISTVMLAAALVANASLLPSPARAENGQIAAGVVGGLIGGALLGGALAARPRLCRRFITRRRRSTLKNLSADWFGSATGTDTAGNSAESRSVTDKANSRDADI
jgi:hypothetical protein